MACIKKLEQNITYDCAKANDPTTIRGIEELILVNYDDISNYSTDGAGLASITMKTGTKGYVVTSVGNSVSATIAAKANEIMATAQEHSVVVKLLDNAGSMGARELSNLINTLQLGTFVACVLTASGNYFAYGLMSGLECSEIAGDSAADGIVSATLKTPDAAGGDRLLAITKAVYDGLKAPKA
ncbi:hypothetical protein BC669P2_00039 [Bacteroides phage BC669P2]|nr:hypothetical protein BC669P2_00039 [Bacteroides phage BC669P2]